MASFLPSYRDSAAVVARQDHMSAVADGDNIMTSKPEADRSYF
jgi:hypothetical protein